MKVSLTKGKVDGQGRGLGLEESLVVQPTNVPTPTEQPPHQPTLYQAWASPDMSNRVAKPGCRRNPSNQIQEAAAPETVLHPGLRCRQSHAATDPVSMSHRPPEPSTTPRFQRTRDDPPPPPPMQRSRTATTGGATSQPSRQQITNPPTPCLERAAAARTASKNAKSTLLAAGSVIP